MYFYGRHPSLTHTWTHDAQKLSGTPKKNQREKYEHMALLENLYSERLLKTLRYKQMIIGSWKKTLIASEIREIL